MLAKPYGAMTFVNGDLELSLALMLEPVSNPDKPAVC